MLGVPSSLATTRAAAWALEQATDPLRDLPAYQRPAPTPAARSAVLVGAGDICLGERIDRASETAALVASLRPAFVFTLGDNAQANGAAAEYRDCFNRTWGAFKDRIRPAAGNHDLMTGRGGPYYDYFGAAAGPRGKGYYSYDVPNGWHVVVLNSQCEDVGGCESGSPQEAWLRRDLAQHAGAHVIAMWHIPAFTSSSARRTKSAYSAFWEDLYAAGAELVLNGHFHNYERFGRQTIAGRADPRGIREFVVGTGGMDQGGWTFQAANSEYRTWGVFGVLELTLNPDSYDWRFIAAGESVPLDQGHEPCHAGGPAAEAPDQPRNW